jgi:hypothetical protein
MFGPCSEKVESRLGAGLEEFRCRIGAGSNHVGSRLGKGWIYDHKSEYGISHLLKLFGSILAHPDDDVLLQMIFM